VPSGELKEYYLQKRELLMGAPPADAPTTAEPEAAAAPAATEQPEVVVIDA
jgi:hypothetical protein